MLDITILAFGRLKEDWWRLAAAEYQLRLRPYVRLKIEELKAEPFNRSNKEEVKKIEAERLRQRLARQAEAVVFLLSEDGKQLTSPELASLLDKQASTIILVIGGSLGFSTEIAATYPRISLSNLTFTHELARVVLLEQIYRAAAIINDKEYHY